jgi:ubiquinone/menaquinone biosynthesis C-methylase UbiE
MQAAAVFDMMAAQYDESFTHSKIGRLQRKRVWHYLHPLLKANGDALEILEINCGTGKDALKLAALGHNVVATDASPLMIEKAKEKLGNYDTSSGALQFMTCAFNDLGNKLEAKRFDLVFSNFGGLNCINRKELEQLASGLSALVKPGGHVFLVLMPPFCLWEMFHFIARAKLKTAFRRVRGVASFTTGGQTMKVYYYRPNSIKKMFGETFVDFEKHPVGLWIPPSYLEERFINKPEKLERLFKREEKFSPAMFSSFADHYCVILKKTGTTE